MSRTFVLAALVAALALANPTAALGGSSVWPKPQHESVTDTQLSLSASSFSFTAAGAGGSSDIITQAFTRYKSIVFRKGALATSDLPAITSLNVVVTTDNETLSLDTNETYTLDVAAPTATLIAGNVFGALRGLETFAQLVKPTAGGYITNATSIVDFPRFHHVSRGAAPGIGVAVALPTKATSTG